MKANSILADKRTAYISVVHVLSALLLSSALFCGFPAIALAGWPVGGCEDVTMGFHDVYELAGRQVTHLGADICAHQGETLCAPLSGRVSFVGSVPAAESSSEDTMLAVSLQLADGKTLTMMPFDGVAVQHGDSVEEGAVLGTLAASGDRSSSATHLHMGLKQDGRYYDPLVFLGFIHSATDDSATDASEEASVRTSSPLDPSNDIIDTEAAQGVPASEEGLADGDAVVPGLGVSQQGALLENGVTSGGSVLDIPISRATTAQYGPLAAWLSQVHACVQHLHAQVCELLVEEFPFIMQPGILVACLFAVIVAGLCAGCVLGMRKVVARVSFFGKTSDGERHLSPSKVHLTRGGVHTGQVNL